MMDLFYCSSFLVCNAPREALATSRPKSMVQLEPIGMIVNSNNFSLSSNVGSHSPILTQHGVLQSHLEMWDLKRATYEGTAHEDVGNYLIPFVTLQGRRMPHLGPYSKSLSQWYSWSLLELL